MVASGKRKRPDAASTRPITAFFERKRPAVAPQDAPQASTGQDASNAVDLVEEIDSEGEEITVLATAEPSITTAFTKQSREPQALNTTHLTRIMHRRELGSRARGVPSTSVRRRRQQTEQRLLRWALTQFRRLPLQLALPDDAMRIVQSNRLASHCAEFFTSCLAFDSQGALLVAGSSNGVIALFDCDELFHRTINMQQDSFAVEPTGSPATAALSPMHMIFTGNEVQRIRWNPLNEDEIACCFLNRNEIFVYNLQKFPSKPYLVLKASSRPSSGYSDLVFLPPSSLVADANTTKHKRRTGSIVAGDVDGMLRAWDLRFPTKPQWAVSTGSQPVTSLLLDHDKRLLMCGTEGGFVVTYDVQKLVVPAFGSKPMPQRKASVRVLDVILPVLSYEASTFLKYTMRESTSVLAVTAMHLVPTSSSQMVLQLRNQWLAILDITTGKAVKLHTPVKELPPSLRPLSQPLPATVLHSAGDGLTSHQRGPVSRSPRHSWLHLHRCPSALVFDGDMICAGLPDDGTLSIVDMNRMDLLRVKRLQTEDVDGGLSSTLLRAEDQVERLSRYCIDMPELVTAVAVHPMQHWILCGGADLRIHVLGVAGHREMDDDGSVASDIFDDANADASSIAEDGYDDAPGMEEVSEVDGSVGDEDFTGA